MIRWDCINGLLPESVTARAQLVFRFKQWIEYRTFRTVKTNCCTAVTICILFLFAGNADQGFAATNHSGTQINLWGQVPGLNWDVRAPNSANIYGSYCNPVPVVPAIYQPNIPTNIENSVTHQQLTMIATQLSQVSTQHGKYFKSD